VVGVGLMWCGGGSIVHRRQASDGKGNPCGHGGQGRVMGPYRGGMPVQCLVVQLPWC